MDLFTTYSDLLKGKGNPYHDERGRFTSGPGGGAGSGKTRKPRSPRRSKELLNRLGSLKGELSALRSNARKAIKDRDPHDFFDVARKLAEFRLKVPVSDYNAKPIPEGRALDKQAANLGIWMEKQYNLYKDTFERRLLERNRQRSLGEIIDRMYGRK